MKMKNVTMKKNKKSNMTRVEKLKAERDTKVAENTETGTEQ